MRSILYLTALVALVSCGQPSGSDDNRGSDRPPEAHRRPGDVVVDERAGGRVVMLPAGHELVVSIGQCGSCGYEWNLLRLPPNLSLVSIDEVSPHRDSGAPVEVGGGFTREYRFHAEQPGDGVVELASRAPDGELSSERLTFPVQTGR